MQELLAHAGGQAKEAGVVLSVLGEDVAAAAPMRELVADWLRRIDADGPAGALRAAARA